MGCNLRDLAESEVIDITELAGKRVGIDSFLVAFQFLTSIRARGATGDGGPLKDGKGRPVSHLMGFLDRATTLLAAGVIPVFIFDGKHPELKVETIAKRSQSRREAQEKWDQALAEGDYPEAQKWGQRAVRYTPEMVEESIEMLHLLGVPAFRGAAEGEGQAAVMAAAGLIDVVATQDWDALLYGSPVLVRNLMSAGSKRMGRVVRAEKIILADVLTENQLSREQLVDLAIMIGTDFHPGIRGIGPKTGLKLIRQHLTIEKVCEFKEIDVPDNLEEIREIFLNHPASTGHELDLKPINTDALREWLAERDFSEGRIERNLEKINKTANIRKSGQASLFDY
jgi:flap endonuclease-1